MSRIVLVCTLIIINSLLFNPAFGLDVVVDSRGSAYADYTTIAQGLAAMPAGGGTVTVNPGLDGIYREYNLSLPDNVCLRSSVAGAGHVTIDGQGLGKVIGIIGASNVQVEGFIITNGDVAQALASGGGINCFMSTVNIVISNCIITGNTAMNGGGMYIARSNCKLIECTISNNTADSTNYNQGLGAGLYIEQSIVNVTLCDFFGNSAGNDGGGILLENSSSVTMRGSEVSGNHAGRNGGGISTTGGYVSFSTLTVESCEISSNTAGNSAPDGFISLEDGPNIVNLNCTEYDPLQWVVQAGGQLNIDPNPMVPCMKMSDAFFPNGSDSVSVLVSPLGTASGPSEASLFGNNSPVDATVTVTLRNNAGDLLDGVAAQDIWLGTANAGMALRPLPDGGTGERYASVADGETGFTGTSGETTISQAIFGGGHSVYPGEKCRVMTNWGPVGKGHLSHPDGIDLSIFFNSPDIDGDFNVDLDDCIQLTEGYDSGAEPGYGRDLSWDGSFNLSDIAQMANHCGEIAGELKHPDSSQNYTVEILFDDNGNLTNRMNAPQYTIVNSYVMIRDYSGGAINGFELGMDVSESAFMTSHVFPNEALDFSSTTGSYNVAFPEPFVPSGSDAVLMEFSILVMSDDPTYFSLNTPAWSSVPGRPVPILRGTDPGDFYELLPPTGSLGGVIATINGISDPLADYGDAPDEPDGHFPTLYETTSAGGTEPGVHHLNVSEEWLGTQVSLEHGAQDPNDPDGVPNLINADGGDDGVQRLYLRRTNSIRGQYYYKTWAKVITSVAAGAPNMYRWLYLLFDADNNHLWRNGPYREITTRRLYTPSGTSRPYYHYLGYIPASSVPSPGEHPWLRATFSREFKEYNWKGAGAFEYGETEDYNDVFYSMAAPGFESYGTGCGLRLGQTKTLISRLKIPAGSSVEIESMEIRATRYYPRPWRYQGADPSVIGTLSTPVGSFIDGTGGMKYLSIPVTPIPISEGFRQQIFYVTLRLKGYDGLQGTGNLVWSSEIYCLVFVYHPPSKSCNGLGELAFGGANVHPTGQPIAVYPEGGGQPMAYVVFGNNQPTPGTLSVMQIALSEPPETDMLPVINIVNADFDIDLETPADEPLVSTIISDFYLTGYDDSMLASAGILEKNLQPYWAPFDADETYDLPSSADMEFYSSFELDTDQNLVKIHDPLDFGMFYMGGSPSTDAASATVSPPTSGPLMCGLADTLIFELTMDTNTPDVFGFNAVVRATSEVNWGAITSLDPFAGTTQFFTFDNGDGSYTISGTTQGNPTQPISGAGTYGLFSIIFHTIDDGTADITFDSFILRDPANQPIDSWATGATIEVDCTPPVAVTDIMATPHHNKVEVSWAHDGLDTDHYEIYRGLWYNTTVGVSAYPEYDDLTGDVIPTREADRSDTQASPQWELAGTVAGGTLTFDDVGPFTADRGVYYYEVFAVDAAMPVGNNSLAAAANDRATNYWLGDMSANGEVAVYDMSVLGTAFGTSEAGGGGYLAPVDVGPTDDWSRTGIPLTDNIIQFEDLMVFSMNFGLVSPTNKSETIICTTADLSWICYGEGRYALRLNGATGLKGVHLRTSVPAGSILSVTAGELLDQQNEMTFLRNIGDGLDVSLAITGVDNGFAGQGDLFIVESTVELTMDQLTLELRGSDNSSIEVGLNSETDTLIPRVFALNHAYPNPFNPMTKISFSLPEAQPVRLNVYGVDGKLVYTLVDETLDAGLHQVIWNGQNNAGTEQASGLYFYRIQAGPYSQVRKMTLLK